MSPYTVALSYWRFINVIIGEKEEKASERERRKGRRRREETG